MGLVVLLDYLSVPVFALTGALVASRAQLDPVGFAFLAALTALGGGTIRDVLLDRDPIFWIAQPVYLAVACGAALAVFFTAHLLESRQRALVWCDSLALAVAVAAGAGVAMELEQSATVVVLMGVITGCLGGLMRDVVVGAVPLVLTRGELYVTAALAGAAVAVGARLWWGDAAPALIAGAVVTWVLRAGAIAFGWHLPVYRARPPRP